MATASFTYQKDFDPNNIVTVDEDIIGFYNDVNTEKSAGIYAGVDRFMIGYGRFSNQNQITFTNYDRTTYDPDIGLIREVLTENQYSVKFDFSDSIATVNLTGGNLGDILIGGAGDDALYGNAGNDILDGGAGGDRFEGGSGINTVTYARSQEGVVATFYGSSFGGDAEGDSFFDIQNLTGSAHNDLLEGDQNDNVLRGNGGLDQLYGMEGDDRLVFSGDATVPMGLGKGFLDGGDGKDVLFFTAGELGSAAVTLEEGSITTIEQIFVRGGVSIDMSAVTEGQRITSQSTDGHAVHITGTAANDVIKAGKGGDHIAGSAGGDKLFAGSGADTFVFKAGFGRDNVYKFDLDADHFDISTLVTSFEDVTIKALHDGKDALITFEGAGAGNKIILHDVAASELTQDHFLIVA